MKISFYYWAESPVSINFMRKSYLFLFGITALGIVLTAGSSRPTFSFRIHAEADDSIRDERALPVGLTKPDEIIRIHKLPVLTEKYITSAMPTSGGGVLLKFNQAGRHLLETVTSTEAGKTLVVFWNGRLVYAADIDIPMRSGRLLIPQGLDSADLMMLSKYLEERKKL
jgi:hypothetical protein